jgi:hypothetical protein
MQQRSSYLYYEQDLHSKNSLTNQMTEVNYLNSKTCIAKNQGSMFPVMLMVQKTYLTAMSQLFHNLIIVIAFFRKIITGLMQS